MSVVGSTYTYLTVMRLEAVAAAAGVTVEWRPSFCDRSCRNKTTVRSLAGLQNSTTCGGMSRGVQKAQSRIRQHSALSGGPGRTCNRVAYVASLEGWCGAYTRATYRDWFLQHRVPGERAHTASLLTRLRRDAETIITRADSEEIRTGLESATRAAATKGIFGSPTFVVGEEIFWGDDRLEDAIEWLLDLPRSAPTH
jgi:2-hydroxychromene-2-carboxylate isomerase